MDPLKLSIVRLDFTERFLAALVMSVDYKFLRESLRTIIISLPEFGLLGVNYCLKILKVYKQCAV